MKILVTAGCLVALTSTVMAAEKLPINWKVESRQDPMNDIVITVALTTATNNVSAGLMLSCLDDNPILAIGSIFLFSGEVPVRIRFDKSEPEIVTAEGDNGSLTWNNADSLTLLRKAKNKKRAVVEFSIFKLARKTMVRNFFSRGCSANASGVR